MIFLCQHIVNCTYLRMRSYYSVYLKQQVVAPLEKPLGKRNGFLNMIGIGTTSCNPKDHMEIQVTEIKDSATTDLCNINLPTTGE